MLKGYDKEFFASRYRFLQAGYYSHIMEEVVGTVERLVTPKHLHKPFTSQVNMHISKAFPQNMHAFRFKRAYFKFYEVKSLFQCPRCGKKIRFHGGGLVCTSSGYW